MDFYVLILDGELGSAHLNFLVSWVLNNHLMGNTLTNGARKFDSLNLRVILNCHLESVVEVLTRVLSQESALELVHTSSEGQEVKLIILVTFSCNVESVGTTNEKSRLCVAFDFPSG